MATVVNFPTPSDTWQFTVEVSRRSDGQLVARLTNCWTALIETGNTQSGAKLNEIADMLEEAIHTMRADASRLGPSTSQIMDNFDAAITSISHPR